ncbi:bifunctional pyr operon transcriptional regulator/uracil phosphoribosyltransferase PyrR [Opitutus terrae]|uniref:Phosphoribosyltransferase n=1 Tax=Opitutus terrae (strain DSM 11246 / JCM 15787 / PB90-1) TaxID=452637 RepID=B1ZT06_OPITP|nr:bifunctional pyr operon transcriptional regulator/uracil phosphoribosyltransferase PyrR [Opitutus terrae]ACB75795.1 phosphoribosyltransferase [Opitutus terrae PB90-1]
MVQPKTIGAREIHAAIERLAAAIAERHGHSRRLLLLGIANGGIELARRLTVRLAQLRPGLAVQSGTIDISFHRDDIGRNPIPKEFAPTHIPGDVNGATVVLVDDVLFSGRTVNAALNELFDHGRPDLVELAILVDRGGRRLPLAADYCALTLEPSADEKVVVRLDPRDPAADVLRVEPAGANRKAAT